MTDLEDIEQLAAEAVQAIRRYVEAEIARLIALTHPGKDDND